MAGPGILFTAFEPSGDALAAPVIAMLRRRRPDMPIWALGGPRMRDAGAELIECTTDRAAMLAGALAHVKAHRARLGRLDAWLGQNTLAAHVPVDSPAANWSICKMVRRTQPNARVIHLAAPQLWAWAPWRIGKLRRLTDQVLCLLPFEPRWFADRGVPATFIGHPVFDEVRASDQTAPAPAIDLPQGQPKLALLPGSRAGEVRANWPIMLDVWRRLRQRHEQLAGAVAAASDDVAVLVRQHLDAAGGAGDDVAGGAGESLTIVTGRSGAVLDWCDVALVVSGTATLTVAAHGKPMVALYRVNPWLWRCLGWWLVRTRTFTLPNLVAQMAGRDRVIDEFVPHFGPIDPIERAVDRLLSDPEARRSQAEDLAWVGSCFAGVRFAQAAGQGILATIDQPGANDP